VTPARLVGLETEYGIYVEGRDPHDWLDEARAVVLAYAGAAAGPWDYEREDPRRDLRGFRVRQLASDPRDAQYDRPGQMPLSQEEQRSDRVLANGARLYNDHGHPEYATPECLSLRDLVAHDVAGERIVLACARARAAQTGRPVHLFKNNTDYHGASYGCHESYLVDRSVPFDRLYATLTPFFVTRTIYAGAGKSAVESPGPWDDVPYQLSQRADFFTEEASVDTLHRRPILNTRDEPHADPGRYLRLHVICGDANVSEFATALKVGTTRLVVALCERGWQPAIRVRRPVEAMRAVSRDPTLRWPVELDDGRFLAAVDLQRIYLEAAQRTFAGADAETDWVLREWAAILDDLERDPLATADRCDWAAKRLLLESYLEAERLSWQDPIVRSLDLEYHAVDPERGLGAALRQEGHLRAIVEETDIQRAMATAPTDTRAWLRGEWVRRFAPAIERIGWERLCVRSNGACRWVSLGPLMGGEVARLAAALREVDSLDAWLARMEGGSTDA